MADYVVLTPIGLPDPDDAESQLNYEHGDRVTLDAEDEDTKGLLANGAICDAEQYDRQVERAHRAQYGNEGDVDRQVEEAAAAQRRQEELMGQISQQLVTGQVVQENPTLVDPDAAQEGAVVFTAPDGSDQDLQGNAAEQPADQALPDGPDTGSGDHTQAEPKGGGGGEVVETEATRTRPPKRSLRAVVAEAQARRDH